MKAPQPAWLHTAAAEHARRPYIIFTDASGSHSLTFEDMFVRTRALARRLSTLGITQGDRIATLMGNRVRMVELLHAAQLLGAVLVPLSPDLTQEELEVPLKTTRPGLLLFTTEHSDTAEAVTSALGLPLCLDAAAGLGAVAESDAEVSTAIDPDAPLTILFTSGTTGCPKGAVLTTHNHHASALSSSRRLAGNSPACWLACLPLYHVGGLAILVRAALGGDTVVLLDRFDPARVVAAMDAYRVTHISVVARMLSRILDELDDGKKLKSLSCVLTGGGRLPAALMRRAIAAGLPVYPTYGLTEAASQVCSASGVRSDAVEGWCGPPLDATEIRIGSPGADGRGQILVRGETVMREYYADPSATCEVLVDGWLHTGDIGYLDEHGELVVECRRSDLIVTGGENVYPVEVESVLRQHPAVLDAAVYGEFDAQWGQRVCAMVEVSGKAPGTDDLRAWCRQRLAHFKVPSKVRAVESLPRNTLGKIIRSKL